MSGAATAHHRYLALDGYRAVAACLVVLFHYNKDFGLGLERWSLVPERLHLLVDFFFVLSGFVVMTAYSERVGDWGAYALFLRRRFARLFPLHALTLATFVALGLLVRGGILGANHPETLSLDGLPANLLMIQSWGVLDHDSFNVPSWSISAEWLAYLVFPVLALSARRLNLPANLLMLGTAVVCLAVWRDSAGMRPLSAATHDFGALRALPAFFAGTLIAHYRARARRGARNPLANCLGTWLGTWPVAHGFFALALAAMHSGLPDWSVVAMLVAVVGAAAAAERGGHPTWLATSFAQRLGADSYAIYMTHLLVSIPILFALRKAGILGTPAAALAALATFGLVLGLSDWIHRRFEQPWRARLSRSAPHRPRSVQPVPAASGPCARASTTA